ncbi:toprim domain-containing protein, partial [Pseudomonas savastanoi]|uniref:toprim domain-containing protein n=1 Tax=Pseudomonas savastanoi TaxID=29438 RepID=UPI001F4045D0
MRLYLCEKPSQGKDIAAVLGAKARGNGCIKGNGVAVTWGIGHLLETAPPDAYGEHLKNWSLDTLPILPAQWKVIVKPKTSSQFKVVKQLLKEATELVIATDADREGELIARELIDYCGYADDLFYLLFRILTRRMIEDGYQPNARGSMAPAAMSFMRDHGVLKDIYTERDGSSHKTAKGKKLSVRTVKAPGFGPKGIHRFVLPFTVFLKLKDIGGNVLPGYREEFIDVPMSPDQEAAHRKLAQTLTIELRQALARRDTTLLGVVLNVLLAWPDCCFRPEVV